MKNLILLLLLISISCSKKITANKIEESTSILNNTKSDSINYLCGKVNQKSKPEKFKPAIVILYYNDTTKIFASTDFDDRFCLYDFKSKLINSESYIYIANVGYKAKKISFEKLQNPIEIILETDSIEGLKETEYKKLIQKNRPHDKN